MSGHACGSGARRKAVAVRPAQGRKDLVLRLIGWILLVLAVILAAYEISLAVGGEGYRLVPLGEVWFRLDQMLGTASLNVSQAVVQRYVWAWLWEAVIQPVLGFPAWAVFGAPGLVLLLIGSRRRRSRRSWS